MTVEQVSTEMFGAALRGEPVGVVTGPNMCRALDVDRWRTLSEDDEQVLGACRGATLDVGCGPGRMTAALSHRPAPALGIDVVPEAVRETLSRGAAAMRRNVFGDVPGLGRWDTVLLADGNIGIGGDPARLLRRIADLLRPGGLLVTDLAPAGSPGGVHSLRLACRGHESEPFEWAVVPVDDIEALAAETGFSVLRTHHLLGTQVAGRERPGRNFAVLVKLR